jgi:hypothetical protein
MISCQLVALNSLQLIERLHLFSALHRRWFGFNQVRDRIELSVQIRISASIYDGRGLFPGYGVKISLADSHVRQIALAEALELV